MKALYVRINDGEHQRLVADSKRLGISLSSFIRLLIKNWSDGVRFEQKAQGAELVNGASSKIRESEQLADSAPDP